MKTTRAELGLAASLIAMLGVSLALSGCTQATISLPDGTEIAFTRTMTEAAIHVGADGLDYNSSPSAAAQQNVTDALVRALGVAVGTAFPPRLATPPMEIKP